jgi:hypothetical protein
VPVDNPFNPGGAARQGAQVTKWSQIQAEQQRLVRETLELVNAGWSHRAVAEKHGCTIQTVSKRYKRGLKKYLPPQEVEAARRALMDRLDTVTLSTLTLMGKAVRAGNIDSYIKLHGSLMAAEDRRIEVMGLQAPKTLVVQQETIEATPQETALQGLLAAARERNEQIKKEMTADAQDEPQPAAA